MTPDQRLDLFVNIVIVFGVAMIVWRIVRSWWQGSSKVIYVPVFIAGFFERQGITTTRHKLGARGWSLARITYRREDFYQ